MVSKQRQKELDRLRSDAQALWRDQQQLLTRANVLARDAQVQAGHFRREQVVPYAQLAYAERVQPQFARIAPVGQVARDAVVGTVLPAVSSATAAALNIAGQVSGRTVDDVEDAHKRADKRAAKAAKAVKGTAAAKAAKAAAKNPRKALKASAAAAALKAASKDPKKALKSAAVVKGAKAAAKDPAKAVKGLAFVKGAQAVAKNPGKTAKVVGKSAKVLAKNPDKVVKAAKVAAKRRNRKGVGTSGVVGIVLGVVAAAGIGYAIWQTLRADDDLWVADDEPELPPTSETPTV